MRTFRQRLTPRAAARILDRPGTAGNDALSLLLAAAAAPSPTDERGEDRAVAEFRAVTRLGQAPTLEGEPFMIKTVRRMMAAPVAALGAAALVLAGGGIALAASQGALDVPFSGHDNRSDKAPAAPATTNPGLTRAATVVPGTSDTPEPTATHTPSATPSPSLSGLCHAFQAGAADVNHSNPAFGALTAAAGGEANVATYCTGLIGPATVHTHPAKPTQAASPTHPAKPTQAATPAHRAMPTQAASPTQRPTPGAH
jgi:hypothetical protein